MKNKVFYIAFLFLCLIGTSSCQNELSVNDSSLGSMLQVKMVTDSRGVQKEYNEDVIRSADVFFFENGSCIYAQTGVTSSDNSLSINVSDKIQAGRQYTIFVVANQSTGLNSSNSIGKTLEEIKNITVTTAWNSGDTPEADLVEEALLMTAESQITVSTEETLTVELKRMMAKVTLAPDVTNSVETEVGGVAATCTPVLSDMKVKLVNGVTKTDLGSQHTAAEGDYMDILRPFKEVDGSYVHVPLYSYPDNSADADAYLLLSLPWSIDTASSQTSSVYYYRIPVGSSAKHPLLQANRHYKINATISVLGSLDPETAVTLPYNSVVLDWSTAEIDASLTLYKYLVLDEISSVLHNKNEYSVAYVSSSDIDMSKTKISSVSYYDYYDENSPQTGFTTLVTETDPGVIQSMGFNVTDEGNGYLKFTHNLKQDDFSPFTIVVEVYNKDDISHVTWKIVQYPAIYIEAEYNPDGDKNRFVYGVGGAGPEISYSDNVSNDQISLGLVTTPEESERNYNLYTINVSSLGPDSPYIIGDPRYYNIGNFSYLLDGKPDDTGYYLQYYDGGDPNLPTNMIAPSFKIASAWGTSKSEGLAMYGSSSRCTVYQENGYPAGRWRLPTEAEIQFIVELSERGYIPKLFDANYYATSGRYYDRKTGQFIHNVNFKAEDVRCVYDVWYWGNEKIDNPNQFYFGDKLRTEQQK